MKLYLVLIIILLASFQQNIAQSTDYAEEIINTVCSEEFHGRGYGMGGDKKTANYI